MSNRLESLHSKSAKPALKFKPKVVARKSKEDREKDAREIKTEEKPRTPATRGRGGARGGRGGRAAAALAGTHMVSAGPLSMGSVALSELKSTRMSYHGHGGGTFNASDDLGSTAVLAKMTLKARSNVPAGGADSDEEDHKAARINMNKEYAYEDSETILFPVRPEKDAEATPEAALTASESVLASLSAPQSRAQSRALTVDSVKSEPEDGVAPDLPPIADVAGDLARAEYDRLIDDQRSIIDLLSSKLGQIKTEDEAALSDKLPTQEQNKTPTEPDQKFLVFQMPQIKPEEHTNLETKSPFANANTLIFNGQVGNINIHKSGKISITMNDGSVFDCSKGTSPSFLQEVYMLDSLAAKKTPEELETNNDIFNANNVKVGGDIYRLGEVVGKIVAQPNI